ncbi:DUF6106 family protein [uncultured Ruminococcus sp.]|uniref:DUF6106 family protein n=1 Tax=uncultured Ruminococcus sp. TaxID=165186 RepID=UPI0025D0C78F|nr:DUF6106 family protein [uncultured Ruminococcus sp.]
MDSFKEQIVKKHNTSRDTVTKICIMVASVALAFAIIFLVLAVPKWAVIGIFIACLCIYGGYYLIQNLNVEYEYIFTNGDLDIDKIIAQRSRKRLATINITNATAVGKADDNFSVRDGRTLVFASACDPEADDYYIDVNNKKLGETTLVFTPDEDMLDLIKHHLPRNLRNSI